MDLYYNYHKLSTLNITPETKIKNIKKIISDWLVPQSILKYIIQLKFNNGTYLDSVVFTTNKYDDDDFTSHADLINGSKIEVFSNDFINNQTMNNQNLSMMSSDVKYVLAEKLSGKDLLNLCATDTSMRMICTERKYDNIWVDKLL